MGNEASASRQDEDRVVVENNGTSLTLDKVILSSVNGVDSSSNDSSIVQNQHQSSGSMKTNASSSRFSSFFRNQLSSAASKNTQQQQQQQQYSNVTHDGSNTSNSIVSPNNNETTDANSVASTQQYPKKKKFLIQRQGQSSPSRQPYVVDGQSSAAQYSSNINVMSVDGDKHPPHSPQRQQQPQLVETVDSRVHDLSQQINTMKITPVGSAPTIQQSSQPPSLHANGNHHPTSYAQKHHHHSHPSAGSFVGDLDEWENAWEEDDESSEGDDQDDLSSAKPPVPFQVPPTFRPAMDEAYSSAVPVHLPSPDSNSVATSLANVIVSQQVSSSLSQTPTGVPPTVGSIPPRDDTHRTLEEERILTLKADKVLAEAMNGFAWDTSSAAPSQGTFGKPKFEMFLPLLRVLGKGSFGKVVLVQKNQGQDRGKLYAMKILKKSHLFRKRQIERTKTERKVLSMVDHPFIMKLHYAFQTVDKLYLVLDYCAGGELFFHLSRLRRFPERVAKFYIAELVLAIGYLHNKGIIYRDLKPENVLLDAHGHVKLGDFGLAKDKITHPYRGASSVCGTPEYMAPEILQQWGHGFCVDYWGLGMLTYEMMTGLPPWYTTDREKLFRRLKSAPLDIPSFFFPPAAAFVSGLLERDPRRRLGVRGVKTVVAHEFFRGLDFRALLRREIEAPIRPCEGWKIPESDSSSHAELISCNQTMSETRSTVLPSKDIDMATQNFDQSFTRMSVNSVAGQEDGGPSADEMNTELSDNAFIGFTFDEIRSSYDQQSETSSGGRRSDSRHLE